MSIEIPAELLSPTIEELEARTAKDLTIKWKPCKKIGKRERDCIKREKEAEKIREIANGIEKPKPIGKNSLSSLFIQNKKQEFSLAAVNNNTKPVLRPTIRASLEKAGQGEIVTNQLPQKPAPSEKRKRGRPPKVNPL